MRERSNAKDAKTAKTARKTRGFLSFFAFFALFAAFALVLAAGALVWAVRSESGTAWLLARVPGLEVTAPRGALLGGDFAAARVQWRGGDGTLVVIDELAWQGLSIGFENQETPPWRVSFERISARRIEFKPAPSTAPAKTPSEPSDLSVLPASIRIGALAIAELRTPALGDKPMTGIAARMALNDDRGREHRIDGIRAQWDRAQFDGDLHIATAKPFAMKSTLHARPAPGSAPAMPWIALVDARGPLARLQLAASLSAAAPPGRNAPSLDAKATVAPFAAWPIASLELSTEALDLSVLSSALPGTALWARATVSSEGLNKPVLVALQLDNRAAGPWNEGKLPLRHAVTDLRGQLDAKSGIELRSFALDLGSAQQPAGRVSGSGTWKREGFSAEARFAEVLTARLDARAAPLSLSGPIALQGRGLPGEASFDATLRGDLHGQPLPPKGVRTPPPAVHLRWQARGNSQRLLVDELRAEADGQSVIAKAEAQRQGANGWRVQAQSQWAAFDPRPWWRGPEDSPWRVGPHRLNGKLDADLSVADIAQLTPAALRGHANLKLDDSQLAGVPISGTATLQAPGGALDARVSLDAAGNHVDAQMHWLTNGNGRGDRWQLDAKAPALARLAPALRLMPGGPSTAAGSLDAKLRIDGRWPVVSSEGQLNAQGLVADELRVATAQARWNLGTSADSRVDLQAELTQAAHGVQRVDRASLRVQGTPRAHEIAFDASSPAKPPAWTEALVTTTASAATTAMLRAKGALTGEPSSPSGWRGSIDQLAVNSGSETLLATRGMEITLQGGAAPSASLSPGRVQLLSGALRIARAHWSGGTQPAVDLQAELEPLVVAPLLARLQPDFGWGGDLAVGGHISVRSAPNFTADVVFERARGDLHVREPAAGTVQPLGLTDLRAALDARDGIWHFTEALAGSSIGVLAGAQSLRVPREALWPAAQTPLEGVLELRVDKLDAWGAWVPAGWRLAGSLHTSASFGGRFGAPELTGHMEGHGIGVRNVLEGVEVRDGEVAIALRGERARIERFSLRAGDGNITLDGEALLGEAPKALLTMKAEHARLLARVDRRIVVSGQGRLQLDAQTVALEGRFDTDEGFIDFSQADAPKLGDDVHVMRGGKPAPEAQQQQQAAQQRPVARKARDVSLDLQLALGEHLRLRGRGLDTALHGSLRFTAPGGKLAVNGSVRAEDGTYAAYGQKLEIERGLLQFNGPVENPRLDIIAIRPNIDLRVGVAVSGPAQNPRVRLFSEPEMAEIDKLSWLVLGRATDGLGRTETALLQRAAFALLAGEGRSSQDPLGQALGLDEISLRQSEGEVKETIVTLGKQLSRRWFVGYERGLNATNGTWQLIYRIAQRFTLRAQSGMDNSLDVIWTWRWN
jgi:translocation and assembly module TamB